MRQPRDTRAFTLLELLVVMGIVAVLAALLSPLLSRAKKMSETAKCTEQLRQMGLAMTAYAEDHAEFLPAAHTVVQWTSTNPVAWTRALLPYFQTKKLLTCPEFQRLHNRSSFNYFMGSRAAFVEAGGQAASVQLSKIRLASQYILSGDTNFPFPQEDADPDNYTQDTLFSAESTGHCRKLNVLFADGHVSSHRHFDPASMTYSYESPGMNWDFP
ncbi:MAG: type II secretion system protein [Verrucomicrobia bacterium]|nr:type II secretion system protein [Verrucomicrobiota bacterium]